MTTFHEYATKVLDWREREGIRSVEDERSRYAKHLVPSTLASLNISRVSSADVAKFLRGVEHKFADDARGVRTLSPLTVKKVRQLVSTVLQRAVEEGLRVDNPALVVPVHGKAEQHAWEILSKAEVEAIRTCEAIPLEARCLMLFAIGTGLRQSEQWRLQVSDIDADMRKVFVGNTKNGKARVVPLFGYGRWAAKEWLEKRTTSSPILFPTSADNRRSKGAPDAFPEWLAAAGIKKHVRWHDLRHTCASSLANGLWGHRWPLLDVRDMLGHSSIKVTEVYLHGSAMHDTAKFMEDV